VLYQLSYRVQLLFARCAEPWSGRRYAIADAAPLLLDASARLESELFYREARWS